jgi:hypothetical protein
MGASKYGAIPVFETAAANLAQMKAKQVLLPLVDIILQRASYIMKRLFKISVEVLKTDREQREGIGILSVYDRFITELRETFERFIDKTENDCRSRLKDDFVMFTKIVDWDLLMSNNLSKEYNFLETTPEETTQRVQEIMNMRGNAMSEIMKSRETNEDLYKKIALMSAKLFAGIRYYFAKYLRNKMNAFFLDPM